MRHLLPGLLAGSLLLAAADAQRLVSFDPLGGLVTELQPPTALLPVPNPPIVTYPSAPLLPPPGPGVPTPGDATFDNVVGLIWYTNGFLLSSMPSPTFPALGPIVPVIPIPPPVMGAIGGPVTGIAIDPVAGIMYMVSIPGIVVGVAPVPGLPIVVPPFPLPFPAPPISGLEWDGATGTLWAVDVAGVAYNFFPGGLPAGPPLAPVAPFVGPPVGDIAIDKIGTVNPLGLRPLYLVSGPMVFDMRNPAAIPFPAGPPGEGLAFMNDPAAVPALAGCEGCAGAGPGPTAYTTSVMSTGNAVFAVGMGGLPPLGFGIFAFDVVAGPFIPINGPLACPLGLGLTPTLILVIGGPAGPGGTIVLPVSLAGVPVGTFLHNQNLTFCAAQPSGFAFSRLQTITAGGF
ncbi:MAG TPA: hypothetical protein VFZ65_22985 [Planctomycetota bacterium]|nr:hypothetical protein [Planctomycetota bacterium]